MYGACVEWETYEANWMYNVLTTTDDLVFGYNLMDEGSTDAFYETANGVKDDHVIYLCYDGYALMCSDDSDVGDDGVRYPRCITAGDPSVTDDLTYWVSTGLLGDELEDFDESYPHCLPASEWPESPSYDQTVAFEQLRWIENLRL